MSYGQQVGNRGKEKNRDLSLKNLSFRCNPVINLLIETTPGEFKGQAMIELNAEIPRSLKLRQRSFQKEMLRKDFR